MAFSIKRVRDNIKTLSLDKQINSEVLLILSFLAVVTGIINLFLSFPVWYGLVFFLAASIGLSLFLINWFKGWYKLTRGILLVLVYLMTVVSWMYNGGLTGSAVLFVSAIIVYSAGIFGKVAWWHAVINLTVFLSLVLLNYFFPATLRYTYISETERVFDMSSAYFIMIISLSVVMKIIFDNYNRATKLIEDQNRELGRLNSEISKVNQELGELNNTKDKLISIISHDLRSPIFSLVDMTSLLQSGLDNYSKSEIENSIRVINKTQQKSAEMLDDLLLWAKTKTNFFTLSTETINLKGICEEIAEERMSQALVKSISVECNVVDDIYVKADRNMLKTIFRNLLSNAIKFTSDGGKVTITAGIAGPDVVIEVADTGMGIISDRLARIWDFKESYSSSGTKGEQGTGLGLLLCKEFTEVQGGSIQVRSEVGKGSNFIFSLPSGN